MSASGTGATGGVAGLLSVSTGLGSALCAMSVRNGVCEVHHVGRDRHRVRPVALHEAVRGHVLRQTAGRTGQERP